MSRPKCLQVVNPHPRLRGSLRGLVFAQAAYLPKGRQRVVAIQARYEGHHVISAEHKIYHAELGRGAPKPDAEHQIQHWTGQRSEEASYRRSLLTNKIRPFLRDCRLATIGMSQLVHGCKVFLDSERFEDSCNHLLKARGLRCLHVGQETGRTSNGDFLHYTVAVFGK